MRVVLLTTDNREHFKDYGAAVPYFGTAPEALLQGFASVPELTVHVVSCTRAKMKSPAKLAPNVFFHSLSVPKLGWMRTAYQGCIRAVRQKLRHIQPDIVHGQGTEGDCALSAVFSGFPNVLTVHGNQRLIAAVTKAKPFSLPWLAAGLERITIPRSKGVVCLTHHTQEAVAGLARRTWVVPNAVDESFFSINVDPPSSEPPAILCIGHVCPLKNQNAFIRALDPLAVERKFKVFFLGQISPGRPYDDEFLSLVKGRAWCWHGGFADREKVKGYFQQAALLALPSLEDNCPMVVLEAMAAGVPVVAAKVGGLPDLIEEGRTGFFCDPLDPSSMREVIPRVLANLSAGREVVRRAKLCAEQRFHPKIIAARHLEIYRDVLEATRVAKSVEALGGS